MNAKVILTTALLFLSIQTKNAVGIVKESVPLKPLSIDIDIKEVYQKRGSKNCFNICERSISNHGTVLPPPILEQLLVEKANKLHVVSNKFSLLDSMLYMGIPVVVGVHHTYNYGYNEGTTDHYVVVRGLGYDSDGKYYKYFDVGSKLFGAMPSNKFRVVGDTLRDKNYYVSRIRYLK